MKTYRFKGKNRSAAAGQLLTPGGIYDLPDDDSHVQSLVLQDLLVEDTHDLVDSISKDDPERKQEIDHEESTNKKSKKTKK